MVVPMAAIAVSSQRLVDWACGTTAPRAAWVQSGSASTPAIT